MKTFIILTLLFWLVAFAYFNAWKTASYPTDPTCFRQHSDGSMTDNSWNVIVEYKDWDILCTQFMSKSNARYFVAK